MADLENWYGAGKRNRVPALEPFGTWAPGMANDGNMGALIDPSRRDPWGRDLDRYRADVLWNALETAFGGRPKPADPGGAASVFGPRLTQGQHALNFVAGMTPMAAVTDAILASEDARVAGARGDLWGAAGATGLGLLALGGIVPPGRGPAATARAAKAIDTPSYLRRGVETPTPTNPTGLPMDIDSRNARLRMMAGDPDYRLYHATPNHFRAFDPKKNLNPADRGATFLTTDPRVADMHIGKYTIPWDSANPLAKEAIPFAPYIQTYGRDPTVFGRLYGPFPPRAHRGDNVMPLTILDKDKFHVVDWRGDYYNERRMKHVLDAAIRARAPGVINRNIRDRNIVADSVAVLDPAKIRSIFATFDPRRKASRNVSAALVPVMSGAGSLYLRPEEDNTSSQ